MHRQVREFCEYVKAKFPDKFHHVRVVDIGSKNWNGDTRYLFTKSRYTGLDLCAGDGVDIVGPAHLAPIESESCDVVISTECLEHDPHWILTLKHAGYWLMPGGLLLITCATEGRPEHATTAHPGHGNVVSDYYHNLTEDDLRFALDPKGLFNAFEFKVDREHCDLYFWGIKNYRKELLDNQPGRA